MRMSKITQQAMQAFDLDTNFKKDNTEVEALTKATYLKLHGNRIAVRYHDGTLMVSDGNCPMSRTTKERLNGINGVLVSTVKGETYLNGKKWNGNLIEVRYGTD